jgi:hypothetical protein
MHGEQEDCGECRFAEKPDERGYPVCMRFPPVIQPGSTSLTGVFPQIRYSWWCGEFSRKPDERKA